VVQHVRRVVDDQRVEVEVLRFASEPSPVAPAEGEAFERLTAAIAAVAPDAVITPFLVVGATDARHYASLTDRVYRFLFLPIRITGSRPSCWPASTASTSGSGSTTTAAWSISTRVSSDPRAES
jgi:hypothetical protein